MVHPKLEPYHKTPFLGRINKQMKSVQRELDRLGCFEYDVDLYSDPKASRLRQFFTVSLAHDPNQWLNVSGTAHEFPFTLSLPFRNGVSLPYVLTIMLRSAADVTANHQSWITPRGRWFTDPLDRERGKAIRSLKLPGVGWTHTAGGLKYTLKEGGGILPPSSERPVNLWWIQSAYQGFLSVRPRIAKYIEAAPRLQQLLLSWTSSRETM